MKKKKANPLKISISITIPFRNKCNYCKSSPTYYQYATTKSSWKDPNEMKMDDEFNQQFPIVYVISKDTTIREVIDNRWKISRFNLTDKSFGVGYHKVRDVHIKDMQYSSNYILKCKCGKSEWKIPCTIKDRVEGKNRQSTINSPQLIIVKRIR